MTLLTLWKTTVTEVFETERCCFPEHFLHGTYEGNRLDNQRGINWFFGINLLFFRYEHELAFHTFRISVMREGNNRKTPIYETSLPEEAWKGQHRICDRKTEDIGKKVGILECEVQAFTSIALDTFCVDSQYAPEGCIPFHLIIFLSTCAMEVCCSHCFFNAFGSCTFMFHPLVCRVLGVRD